VDTTGATAEPQEPDDVTSCASGGGTSVWYRFTPDRSMRIAAAVSQIDVEIWAGMYRGTSLENLDLIGCGAQIFATVDAGETYYVQAGGVLGAMGTAFFELNFHAPVAPPCPECPSFRNYVAPDNPATEAPYRAGEVSIGVNPKTNAAMMLMLTRTFRITFDEHDDAEWKDVSAVITSRTTNDPILWTDQMTGRTFVSQMIAAVGSIVAYTDDDGDSWTTSEPGITQPSWDHQTIGGGRYPGSLSALGTVYENAVYFCAQSGFPFNQCVRSDNGGLTWGAPLPMNALFCQGLHGHVAVSGDGTVVVPHKSCNREQGIEVSDDGATTWQLRIVPGTQASRNDPKVAFDAADRMYFAAESGGKAVVATSADDGRTWSELVDLGAAHGVRNTAFPMVIAGSEGRAAVAFYGTQSDGDSQAADFADEWHLYTAFTYDGGETWQTVDVTPVDPVQRGCIWLGGGSNPCRNLLDFQDMTIDAQGRVLVGYADGCVGEECLGIYGRPIDSRASVGVIARQMSGWGLLAEHDGSF
ncbi:MAG TPA: sialidase family protein, partial [Actinomycetota bacterium]|nr:sialidase family protein [Actinomycetota bacterium]